MTRFLSGLLTGCLLVPLGLSCAHSQTDFY